MLVHFLPPVASIFFILAYRVEEGRKCSLYSLAGSLVYIIYNFLIEATMALIIGPVGVLYIISTAYWTERKSMTLAVMYILCVLIISVIGYQNYWDLFAPLAVLFSTISLLFQGSVKHRKCFGIASCSSWLIYAVFVDAYGMMITMPVFILSTIQTLLAPNVFLPLRRLLKPSPDMAVTKKL